MFNEEGNKPVLHVVKDEWLRRTSDGCNTCGQPIAFAHHNLIGWVEAWNGGGSATWVPLCLECTKEYLPEGQEAAWYDSVIPF